MRVKLEAGDVLLPGVDATNTIMVDTDFLTALESQWRQNVDLPYVFKNIRETDYNWWKCPKGMIDFVKGANTHAWYTAKYVITVCLVPPFHWVTVRICLTDWKIELYDSMWWQLDVVSRFERRVYMRSLKHFLVELLRQFGFWESK